MRNHDVSYLARELARREAERRQRDILAGGAPEVGTDGVADPPHDTSEDLQEHVDATDPHPQYETQAEAEARAAAAVNAHEAEADPHPAYETSAEAQGKVDAHAATPHPTADEKAALAGSSGSPGAGNRYVTDSDARNTNSRPPTGPAGGDLRGTYPNPRLRYAAIQKWGLD